MGPLEMPECYRETSPRARIQHKCCECGKCIEKDDRYHYISGIWGGAPQNYKQCDKCYALVSKARDLLDEYDLDPEEGPPFGRLYDWVEEFADRDGNLMKQDLGIEL